MDPSIRQRAHTTSNKKQVKDRQVGIEEEEEEEE